MNSKILYQKFIYISSQFSFDFILSPSLFYLEKRLKYSIQRNGIIFPLIIYQYQDKHILVDGAKRFFTNSFFNLQDKVPALILSSQNTLEKIIEISFNIHTETKALTIINFAKFFILLYKQFGFSEEKIFSFFMNKGNLSHYEIILIKELVKLPLKNLKLLQKQYKNLDKNTIFAYTLLKQKEYVRFANLILRSGFSKSHTKQLIERLLDIERYKKDAIIFLKNEYKNLTIRKINRKELATKLLIIMEKELSWH